MQTHNNEVFGTNVKDLEVFTGGLIVDNLNIGVAFLFEPDNDQVALMEGHFGREILLDGADNKDIIDSCKFNDIHVSNNEIVVEDILLAFDVLQSNVRHILYLFGLQVSDYVVAVLETRKKVLPQIRQLFYVHRRTSPTLCLPLIRDLTNELLLSLIGRQHIHKEDVAVGTHKGHLTTGSLLVNRPLTDQGVGLLSFQSDDVFAAVVQNSNLLLHSHEDAHLSQFYLVDVEVTDVVSEAGARNLALRTDGKQGQIMQS